MENINTIIFVLCISSTILILPDSIIKNLEIKLFSSNDEYLKYMSITAVSTSLINLATFVSINHYTPFSKYVKYQINTALSIFSILVKITYLNPNSDANHSLAYLIFMKSLQSIDTTLLLPITITYLFINEYSNREQLISRLNGFIYLVGFASPFLLNLFMKFNYITEYQVLYLLLVFQIFQMILIYVYIPRGDRFKNQHQIVSKGSSANASYAYCSLTIITTFVLKFSQLATFAFIPVIISVGLMHEKPLFTNISLNFLNGIYSLISLFSYFIVDKYIDKAISNLTKNRKNNKQKDHIHLFIANCVNLILNIVLAVTINHDNNKLVVATWAFMILKSVFQYNSNIILVILINHISMRYSDSTLDKMNNNLFSLFSIMEMVFASFITFIGFKLFQFYGNTFYFLYLGLILAILSFFINLWFLPNIIKNEYDIDDQKTPLETPLLMSREFV